MTICESLSQVKKMEESIESGRSSFNGYVEDYLMMYEDNVPHTLKVALEDLMNINNSFKICVGLVLDIKSSVITNRIIRYKDAFKIAEHALKIPYIVYGKNANNEDRAVMIELGDTLAFIKIKGYYYCMSEPGSIYEKSRNEMIAVCNDLQNVFNLIFSECEKTGVIQRNYDKFFFKDYEQLKTIGFSLALKLKETCKCEVSEMRDEEKETYIRTNIVTWFLIKKVLYVQYMMNKNILANVHNGDLKAQRTIAKEMSDKVEFLSYYEMWRLK